MASSYQLEFFKKTISLDCVLTNHSENLPIIVRTCTNGYSHPDDLEDFIPVGTEMLLERTAKIEYAHIRVLPLDNDSKITAQNNDENIQGHNQFVDEEFLIPANFPCRLKIVHLPNERKRLASISEIIENPRVDTAIKSVQFGEQPQEFTVPIQTKLEPKESILHSTTVLDDEAYSLQDISAKKFMLPMEVEFQSILPEEIAQYDDDLVRNILTITKAPIKILGFVLHDILISWINLQEDLKLKYKIVLIPAALWTKETVHMHRSKSANDKLYATNEHFPKCDDSSSIVDNKLYVMLPDTYVVTSLLKEIKHTREDNDERYVVNHHVSEVKDDGSEVKDDGSEVNGDGSEVNGDGSEVKEDGSEVKEDRFEVKDDGSEVKDDVFEVKDDGSEFNVDGSVVNDDRSEVNGNGSEVKDERSEVMDEGSDTRSCLGESSHVPERIKLTARCDDIVTETVLLPTVKVSWKQTNKGNIFGRFLKPKNIKPPPIHRKPTNLLHPKEQCKHGEPIKYVLRPLPTTPSEKQLILKNNDDGYEDIKDMIENDGYETVGQKEMTTPSTGKRARARNKVTLKKQEAQGYTVDDAGYDKRDKLNVDQQNSTIPREKQPIRELDEDGYDIVGGKSPKYVSVIEIEFDTVNRPNQNADDFFEYTVEEVEKCFNICVNEKLAKQCKEHKIDGAFFKKVKIKAVLSKKPFLLKGIDLIKTQKAIDGWRPKHNK